MIVGGGKVGYHLSKALLEEGHEVLVLEKDSKKCQHVNEELGSICVRGDGCETATLAEAGAARADMFIAVTDEDEDNLVACQVAKYKFQVPRTIARINNPKNEALFKMLGIDHTVSSTSLILERIEEEVPTHPLTHLFNLEGTGLEIVEVRVSPDSKAAGKRIRDIPLPAGCILFLLIRGDRPEVPTSDTTLQADDRVLAVTRSEAEGELQAMLRSS